MNYNKRYDNSPSYYNKKHSRTSTPTSFKQEILDEFDEFNNKYRRTQNYDYRTPSIKSSNSDKSQEEIEDAINQVERKIEAEIGGTGHSSNTKIENNHIYRRIPIMDTFNGKRQVTYI